MPDPLTDEALALVAGTLAAVLTDTPLLAGTVVVIGGGMARSFPEIVASVRAATGLVIEPTCAGELKSAASIAMFDHTVPAEPS